MLFVADTAKEKVGEIMASEKLSDDYFVRVSVVSGGCSGLSYKMDFDNESQPNDQVFEDKGIRIIVDSKSFIYLSGTQLDFVDSLNGSGFTFENPNATQSCGCGSSFQA